MKYKSKNNPYKHEATAVQALAAEPPVLAAAAAVAAFSISRSLI